MKLGRSSLRSPTQPGAQESAAPERSPPPHLVEMKYIVGIGG